MVESVGEYLQEGVESSPGLLDKNLRKELVEESLDPQRFNLRVDEEPAVGLHYAGGQRHGALVLDLVRGEILLVGNNYNKTKIIPMLQNFSVKI